MKECNHEGTVKSNFFFIMGDSNFYCIDCNRRVNE
jgi:hypothetical protein